MNSVQILESSSSENDKANILGVLLNIYYILGRSLTASKKYPLNSLNVMRKTKTDRGYSKVTTATSNWNTRISFVKSSYCSDWLYYIICICLENLP